MQPPLPPCPLGTRTPPHAVLLLLLLCGCLAHAGTYSVQAPHSLAHSRPPPCPLAPPQIPRAMVLLLGGCMSQDAIHYTTPATHSLAVITAGYFVYDLGQVRQLQGTWLLAGRQQGGGELGSWLVGSSLSWQLRTWNGPSSSNAARACTPGTAPLSLTAAAPPPALLSHRCCCALSKRALPTWCMRSPACPSSCMLQSQGLWSHMVR